MPIYGSQVTVTCPYMVISDSNMPIYGNQVTVTCPMPIYGNRSKRRRPAVLQGNSVEVVVVVGVYTHYLLF